MPSEGPGAPFLTHPYQFLAQQHMTVKGSQSPNVASVENISEFSQASPWLSENTSGTLPLCQAPGHQVLTLKTRVHWLFFSLCPWKSLSADTRLQVLQSLAMPK